ncbi:hypothetical protein KY284_027344 [Solanum tuberosum]|nr:hypothetical protein KY284_027344 [Solanum tuberosum]
MCWRIAGDESRSKSQSRLTHPDLDNFAGDSIDKIKIICEIDIKSEDDQKWRYLRSVARENHQFHHIRKDVGDRNILITVKFIKSLQDFDND